MREIQTIFVTPLICIGGNFNRVDVKKITDTINDIEIIQPMATRGGALLEIALVNFGDYLITKSAKTAGCRIIVYCTWNSRSSVNTSSNGSNIKQE